MVIKELVFMLCMVIVMQSCNTSKESSQHKAEKPDIQNWKVEVEQTLKLFGHRNWIVIADGAYPQQSNPAIKTIATGEDQLEVVEFVNNLIEGAGHVEANIFVDKEMKYVPESEANGIENYRLKLNEMLKDKPVKTMLHEEIIEELDASAKLFNVLIIKTDLAIPYTSVFFQLECGYWNSKAEENLRLKLNQN